ncbi:UNVERIFIED_CONTAM: F-box only protein 6 [Sesamum radiatum]|uniref:F-box only protein 6 n=1 Tax=Sesamum radiatum TaxID=300843 RepID=A0AAW2TW18_SESRA
MRMLEPGKPPPTKKARKERNQGKATASTSSTENMEQDIWKDFPEDLFEAVIARLPIATFFRFRSVCQVAPSNCACLADQIDCVASGISRGLVCFLDIGHRGFYVCNPLTRSFKELPARSVKVWSRVAVGMTLNGKSASSGYKILWVGCGGEYEVYDSKKNCWTRPGNMPSSIKLPLALNFRSQAVAVEGMLYFMRSDPDGLVSYDSTTGIWKQFVIPAPPHLSDHTIAECGGRIMLVGLLTKNAATCVCIWELQRMTLLWKEVDRMPNIWCLEFYGKHVRMTCLGNKGLLMLSLRSRQMNRLVTYDLSTGEWLKVPGCILPRGRKRQWIACGTAFHPCLTAMA